MYNMMNQSQHEATLDALIDMEKKDVRNHSKKPYRENRPYHMTVVAKEWMAFKRIVEFITFITYTIFGVWVLKNGRLYY